MEEEEEDRRRQRETERRRGDRRFRLEFLPFFYYLSLPCPIRDRFNSTYNKVWKKVAHSQYLHLRSSGLLFFLFFFLNKKFIVTT